MRGAKEEMITTIDTLQEALERKLRLEPQEASEAALTVLNYFGYNTVIIDNALDPEDRKLFYQIHDAGLLNTFWETVILPSGRAWRSFYWELDVNAIERTSENDDEKKEEEVYDSLPDDIWLRVTS